MLSYLRQDFAAGNQAATKADNSYEGLVPPVPSLMLSEVVVVV